VPWKEVLREFARISGRTSQGMVLDVREVDGEARVDLPEVRTTEAVSESPIQLRARSRSQEKPSRCISRPC